jgi:release factor glutamine methyltransferase
MKTLGRIKQLCLKHKVGCKVIKEIDLHNDGNMHYILELTKDSEQ